MGKTYKRGDKVSRLFGAKSISEKEADRKKKKEEKKREQAFQKRYIEDDKNE